MSVEEIPFFGRQSDLDYLSERIQHSGVTVVSARPQMGKSRLLRQLRDQLRALSADEQTHLVGYCESSGQEPDLMLRSLEDLYKNWLADSSYAEQAQMLWQQHKGRVIEHLGNGAAEIFAPASKAYDPSGTLGASIKSFLRGLIDANNELKTGGISLKRLAYDQSRDVLECAGLLSEKKCLLIFDALDQSPDSRLEVANLNLFLKNLTDWVDCHFLIAVREPAATEAEDVAYQQAQALCAISARAEQHSLRPIELGDEERDQLLQFLHQHVPVTKEIDGDWLMAQIAGNPATLARWTQEIPIPDSQEALEQLANDARVLRYREIPVILERLRTTDDELFRVALRLALLPEFPANSIWSDIASIVVSENWRGQLSSLKQADFLIRDDYPSIGHTSRYEVAQKFCVAEYGGYCTEEAHAIIIALAGEIRDVDLSTLPYAATLSAMKSAANQLKLGAGYVNLCNTASSMLGQAAESYGRASERIDANRKLTDAYPEIAIIVSMGLVNALHDATVEDQPALLDELRQLANQHPDDDNVRNRLAMGLFNAFNWAAAEDQPALLDELRQLANQHPDDDNVREQLAMGLVNAFNRAATEDQPALLDELRQLANQHPDDDNVREQLAMGLFNALHDATVEDQPALLDELRQLANQHPDDDDVRKRLAMGLVNALHDAAAEDQPALLDELRQLANQHPDDDNVRNRLAMGLFNALHDAAAEDQPALLDELRQLANQHPDDDNVRKRLAMGLVNALNDANTENEPILLDELRQLANQHPDDDNVRKRLAMGLGRTLISTDTRDQPALLDEFLRLSANLEDEAPAMLTAALSSAEDPYALLDYFRRLAPEDSENADDS